FVNFSSWINIDYAIAPVTIYLFCSKFNILISFISAFTKVAALIFFNTIALFYTCVIMCFIVMPTKILVKHFQCLYFVITVRLKYLYFVITVRLKYLTFALNFVYYFDHSNNLSA